MKAWIKQYHQERAAEAEALRKARQEGVGHYFKAGDEDHIAWPNGEIQPAAEYEQWANLQRLNAQYGPYG